MELRVAITQLPTWNHVYEHVCVCVQVRSETVQRPVRRTNRPQTCADEAGRSRVFKLNTFK